MPKQPSAKKSGKAVPATPAPAPKKGSSGQPLTSAETRAAEFAKKYTFDAIYDSVTNAATQRLLRAGGAISSSDEIKKLIPALVVMETAAHVGGALLFAKKRGGVNVRASDVESYSAFSRGIRQIGSNHARRRTRKIVHKNAASTTTTTTTTST